MYDKKQIQRLVSYITSFNGIGDKTKLTQLVQQKFSLTKDRTVFFNDSFSIRFSSSKSRKMSNTVLSLSALQKYDRNPFLVCVVTPTANHLLLANTTFLKKISHSSRDLRVDNIKGSFNGPDIMQTFGTLENTPAFFEELFAYHSELSFQDNLERLVESTNGIVGRVPKFNVTDAIRTKILCSVHRANQFLSSSEFHNLKEDLDERVKRVQGEIAIAAFIENINIRGRIIEYLITSDGSTLKDQIICSLHNKTPIPHFKTEDKLGDYSKEYPSYFAEVDIKTKILFLDGNPKAYNIDKLLEFLATSKSVYMIYLLGIDEHGQITSRLCSAFDSRLISSTKITHHWAGRSTRGVAQFLGFGLGRILSEPPTNIIDESAAAAFLQELIDR